MCKAMAHRPWRGHIAAGPSLIWMKVPQLRIVIIALVNSSAHHVLCLPVARSAFVI